MSAPDTAAPPPRGRRLFMTRLTLATALGEGLDGYDLGIISVVLPLIAADLDVAPVWAGLIGASSLIGIFIGAPLFGRVTDRFGRRWPFIVNLMCFVVLGLLQAVVSSPEQLFVVRLLLGMAIGGEYAIGAPLLLEFARPERRGRAGSVLMVWWYAGFLFSVVAGYFMLDVLDWGWRGILATSAVPAVLTLAVRLGLPESPRWLVSRGRREEAGEIAREYVDDEGFDRELRGERQIHGDIRDLLSPAYRSRTLLVCGFWALLVAPYFAIVTFAPQVFGALHLAARASTVATNAIALLGATTGMLIMDRVGRRTMLIAPFWICAAALTVVGIWPQGPVPVIMACFVLFAFFNALAADLCGVYPTELFPTDLRTSGVGVAAAASRIGAAIGTFLLPLGLNTVGVGPSMLVGAMFCVAGAIICQLWAPETVGRSLTETSRPMGRRRRREPAEAMSGG
jgi:putative MFS transporter